MSVARLGDALPGAMDFCSRVGGFTFQSDRPTVREPDEADQAAQEEEQRLVLRALDRDIRLLDKIDAALRRLTRGEYAIDAKTRRENREQHYRPVRGG